MSEKHEDFITVLETGCRDVLKDKKSSARDKMDAVNAGTKLLLIKHKISDSSDEPGGFFKKGK